MAFVRRSPTCRPELFDKVDGEPFRQAFQQWAKIRRLGLNVPANYGKFNTDQEVSREFVIEMHRYLKSLGRECTLAELMEACEAPDRERTPDFFSPSAGFSDFLSYLLQGFSLHKSSFIQGIDPGEFETAAEIILHCVGKHANPRLSHEEAVASGAKAMLQTPSSLAEMLRLCHSKNRKSVLYARCRIGRAMRTAAVGWMVAVTDDFYERMAAGRAEDLDLTADDILPSGSNLFIAIIDNLTLDEHRTSKARAIRNLAMMKTSCYQFAALTKGLRRHSYERVRWIAMLATVPKNEPHATAHGFRHTGTFSPHTGFPIVVLERPTRATRDTLYQTKAAFRKAVIEYEAMLFIGRIFSRLSDARRS